MPEPIKLLVGLRVHMPEAIPVFESTRIEPTVWLLVDGVPVQVAIEPEYLRLDPELRRGRV